MYVIVTVAAWIVVPRATEPLQAWPAAWLIVLVNLLAVLSIPAAIQFHRSGLAFVGSCLTVGAFVMLLGIALFPNLVTSNPIAGNSLTIYNAASSQTTLSIMLIVAMIGMPFVVTYTLVIYWVFRGRVAIGAQKA